MSGDNFVGAIYRIIYKDAKDSHNESSLILKIAPSARVNREKQRLHELFVREIFIYDQVCSTLIEKSREKVYSVSLCNGMIGFSGFISFPRIKIVKRS